MVLSNAKTNKYDIKCDLCGFLREGYETAEQAQEAEEIAYFVAKAPYFKLIGTNKDMPHVNCPQCIPVMD